MARVQRLLAALAAACFLLGTLAALPAAAVGGPQIERFPKATSDTILKAHCHGFDVHFVYRATQLVTIAFSETTVFSAGSFNGTVARVLPNGHDGSTIAFSFSGASSFDFNSGLVVAHGPTLFAGPDDPTTAEWEGALFLASGNTVADPANGTFLSSTRPVRDLCAELAAA